MKGMRFLLCWVFLFCGVAGSGVAGEAEDPAKASAQVEEKRETKVEKVERGIEKDAEKVGKGIRNGEHAVESSMQEGAQNYGTGLTN